MGEGRVEGKLHARGCPSSLNPCASFHSRSLYSSAPVTLTFRIVILILAIHALTGARLLGHPRALLLVWELLSVMAINLDTENGRCFLFVFLPLESKGIDREKLIDPQGKQTLFKLLGVRASRRVTSWWSLPSTLRLRAPTLDAFTHVSILTLSSSSWLARRPVSTLKKRHRSSAKAGPLCQPGVLCVTLLIVCQSLSTIPAALRCTGEKIPPSRES